MPTVEQYVLKRTTLEAAAPALARGLRLAMEQPTAGHIVTLDVEGEENVFAQLSTGLDGPASVLGTLPGSKYMRGGLSLSSRALARLVRRRWTLAGAADGMEGYHSRDWDGITTRAGRQHVAEEIVSVLTELFGLPAGRAATVSVNFEATASE